MKIRPIPAIIQYMVASSGLTWIYQNVLTSQKVLTAAFLGFVVFGVYDLTNYAVFTNYTLRMVLQDWLWGISSYAFIMYLATIFVPKLSNAL